MDLDIRIDESYIPTPSPSETAVPLESEVVDFRSEEERAVYDGDISDSILRKLSAYYNTYSDLGDDYVIIRESQYVYVLVFGSESSRTFTGTIVRYTSSTYTADCTVSVSSGTYRADMTGDTGYIYSSINSFLPSPYIDEVGRMSSKLGGISAIIISLSALCAVCFTMFRSLRGRRI